MNHYKDIYIYNWVSMVYREYNRLRVYNWLFRVFFWDEILASHLLGFFHKQLFFWIPSLNNQYFVPRHSMYGIFTYMCYYGKCKSICHTLSVWWDRNSYLFFFGGITFLRFTCMEKIQQDGAFKGGHEGDGSKWNPKHFRVGKGVESIRI